MFDIKQDEPIAVINILGEIVMSAAFDQEDDLQVVTDRSARLYSATGQEKESMDFRGMHLLAFDNNDKGQVTLALDTYGDGNDLTLVNLSDKFKNEYKVSASGPVMCVKNVDDSVLLLADTGLSVYSTDLAQKTDIESGDAFLCAGSKSDIYTISAGSIVKEKLPIFTTE